MVLIGFMDLFFGITNMYYAVNGSIPSAVIGALCFFSAGFATKDWIKEKVEYFTDKSIKSWWS